MEKTEAAATFNKLMEDTRKEFPDFKVKYKRDSGIMRAIDRLLKIITFGRMQTFMTVFITTYGNDIYVPDDWGARDPLQKCVILRHERVHFRQQLRYGSIKWLSSLVFSLLYIMWILPGGLSLGRRNFEQEAYEESLRARAEYYGVEALYDDDYRAFLVNTFISAEYFWMWPFRKSVERWYDDTVLKILVELDTAE